MPSKNSQNIPPTLQTKQQLSNQFAAQNNRPKKDIPSSIQPSSYELKQTRPLPPDPLFPSQQKKSPHRSSKPILNWFQRKLAGTVRARRASEGDNLRVSNQRHSSRRPSVKDRQRKLPGSPLPVAKPLGSSGTTRYDPAPKTISLNEDDGYSSAPGDSQRFDDEDESLSLAPESTWSPASVFEADDNASLRPLPPSAPPSPSPSPSSCSYLSNSRTFRSMTASTKPTTILSVDLTGGVAHIAQAPPTPVSAAPRFSPHVRTSSTATSTGLGGGGSITFSALPLSLQSSRPSSSLNNTSGNLRPVQAPQHTAHHPRNNPRPSSPPSDNASVLTLASSAFAFPGARIGANALAYNAERSTTGAGDSISHISASHFLLSEDDRMFNDGEVERDADASVRALRPRSSRRGSWESEGSGWSASVGGAYSMTPGTPTGTRSLWTTNSIRTGELLDEEADEVTSVEQDEGDKPQDLPADGQEVVLASGQNEVEPSPAVPVLEEKPREAMDAAAKSPLSDPLEASAVPSTPKREDEKPEDVPNTPKAEPEKRTEEATLTGRPPLGLKQASDLSEAGSWYSARSTSLPQ